MVSQVKQVAIRYHSSSFSLTPYSSTDVGPGSFACAKRGAIAICSWPLLLQSFSLSSLLFLFSPSFAFDPLRETPLCEIIFAPIFWHN